MDRQPITAQSELEHILIDESAKPMALPLSLLKHICNGFSDDRKIGSGGFSRVYKGMLGNGMVVAVKKLLELVDMDDKKFKEEVRCLMEAKQKNIVRFLGYCADTQSEMLRVEGRLQLIEVRQRLLCFEYLPQGNLDTKIRDASHELEWSKCYKIITGICDGLYYLHQNSILHLDLKPANILLDDNMIPKIADFGLSRIFDEGQSWINTSKVSGTLGYVAPEFFRERKITVKLDIFSLGIIIIEMLTGEKGHPNIDNVLERWRSRLDKTQGDSQLVQVRVCTEIGIQCTDSDPVKRPFIQHIVDRLGATKSVDESATETGASSSSLVAQPGVPPVGPSLVRLRHTNPDVLHIRDLVKVKSVEEARSIKLMEKKRTEALSRKWKNCVWFVEDDVPESYVYVKNLKITDYKGATLPHWCMDISKYLPNLVSLYLWGLKLASLPTLVHLPNLRKIVLGHMPNLGEFNTTCSMDEDGTNELKLAKLEYLQIYCCPNLTIKPCPPTVVYWYLHSSDDVLSSWGEHASSTATSSSSSPVNNLKIEQSYLPLCDWSLLHHLHGLSDLTIAYCKDLTISPEIIRAFTSLESLSLGNHGMQKLPGWLGELTSLRQLNVKRYYGLEEFHENMRQLTQLQSLSLLDCKKLRSLPQWLGELTLLRTLEIDTCEAMISLPESILANLQELHISNSPKLYEWCQLKENQMKLAHIKYKVMYEGQSPRVDGPWEALRR